MYSLIRHGRRSVELQKTWRNLNPFQNASAFLNSFSSASATVDVRPRDGRKGHNFTVSYLVDSLGLTKKLAESISTKISFEDNGNPDSVLNLFRSHGFTDSQISSIITDYPQFLIVDAEKSLGPKLQFLQSRGASTSEITEIVSKVPKILGMKEDKTISRYYDFAKDILREGVLCHSSPQGSRQENKIRNVLALRELGMPQKLLFSTLISNFNTGCGKEKFEESLKKVVEMGFDPNTSKFVLAIYALSDKTIEEKVNVYKRLGFAEGDVWEIFKKWPYFLTYSEKKITHKFKTLKKFGLVEDEVLSVFKKFPQCIGSSEQKIMNSIETFIGLGFRRDEFAMMVRRFPMCIGYSAESVKKKTEFVVKKMGWPLKAVFSYPQLLGLSMEKRIVPRCNVIRALMSRRLLVEFPPISSVLSCTDEAFLNRFVRKHDDDKELVAELMAIFTGKDEKRQIKAF